MNGASQTSIRFLKAYVFGVTSLLLVLALSAFRDSPQKQRFEEIDVERMNIVEKDGKVRMIVANKARFPGLFVSGAEHPYPRGLAGIAFIDEDGTESGTLATHTRREAGGFGAYSGLLAGRADVPASVGMVYDDDNGRREAGLVVKEGPMKTVAQLLEQGKAVANMPAGPAKSSAMAELRRADGTQRIRVGKTRDRAAAVELSDPQGKPRLRLVVDPAGAPHLDFLDASGHVTRSLSGSAEGTQR